MTTSKRQESVLRGSFLPFWVGQTVSALGDRVVLIALPGIVLALGGTAQELARLAAWYGLSELAFLIVGGVVVDRWSKGALLFWMDIVRAALFALVVYLYARGQLTLDSLAIVYIIQGACSSVSMPATTSIVPEIVPSDRLVAANALRNGSLQIVGIAGPAFGGVILALGGVGLAMGFNAASFACGALGIALMGRGIGRSTSDSRQHGSLNFVSEALEGFRVVARTDWLWVTIAVFSFANVFYGSLNAILLPLFAQKVLGNVGALGWLYTAEAIGAVIATLILGRLNFRQGRGKLAFTAVLLQGLAIVGLAISTNLWLALIAAGLSGTFLTLFGVLWESLIQEKVPEEVLGRVASVDMLGSFGLTPLGFVLLGPIFATMTVTNAILVCGVVVAAVALMGISTPAIRRLA